MEFSKESVLNGLVLVVNKPLDWTSFDVVNKLRYELKKAIGVKKLKVGHAGTLDPKATGVLVVCTGKMTKQIDAIQATEKQYVATLKLGATTPSYDTETGEDQTFEINHISAESIGESLKKFTGEFFQDPPLFSAVRKEGKRLYEYARAGEEVKINPRLVNIHKIELLNWEKEKLAIDVTCGKGTYIRSLAHDIGKALESGAYLTGLVRTRVGDYKLEAAFDMPDLISKIQNIAASE